MGNNEDMEFEKESRGGSGIGGKIIALSLGFVLGIGSTIGGVAGLGYWAMKRPIKDVENLAQNAIPKLDLSQYLTDEYYNGTILNLLGGVKNAISDISAGKGGFASLAKISPTVKKSVRELSKKVKSLGSNLEEDAIFNSLMDLPFSDFGNYLSQTLLKSIELGPMLLGAGAFTFDTLTNDRLMMTLLYGVEGEDYQITVSTDENGKTTKSITQIEGGRKPLSVGEIQDGGIDPLLAYITVDSLLSIKEGDGMMCSLAYGKSSHYTFVDSDKKDENGNPLRVVQMNPRAYTSPDGVTFYDEEGNALDCEASAIEGVANAYKLTFKDSAGNVIDTQYAIIPATPSAVALSAQAQTENAVYSVYSDEAFTKQLTFKKTTFADLMNSPENLLGSLEIATVMDLNGKENLNPILAILAYGQEGEDFIWVEKTENGEVVKGEDGKPVKLVQLLPGKFPKTIDALQGDALSNLITDLPLSSILNSIDTEDAMMMALAYGAETHYLVENGQVQMKQVEYSFSENKWWDIDGNELNATLDETTNKLTITDGETTKEVFVALDSASGKYLEIDENGNAVKYQKTTIGMLQNDPMALLDTMEIASLMEITATSNPILLAIAYGVEDEDYEIVETTENGVTKKEIQMLPGKKPRKLSDLQGDDLNSLVTDLPLASLIEIDSNDSIMMTFAYGSTSHYTIDEHGTVHMKQVEYEKDEEGWFDINGKELNATFDESTGILTIVDGEDTEEAYIVYDASKNRYYEFKQDDHTKPVLYTKTTIGTLQTDSGALLDTLDIASIMDITADSNPVLLALAYGIEGEDYEIVETTENGVTKKEIKMFHGKTPRKLHDLQGEELDSFVTDLPLASLIEVDTEDSLMMALAYGNSKHYLVENGQVSMKQVEYTKNGNKWLDINGDELNATFDETTGILTIVDGENTEEAYIVYDSESGKYFEFKQDNHTKPVLYAKTTVGTLQTDSSSLLDTIEIASLMDINADSNPVLRALAYGVEDEDYEIVETTENGVTKKEIQMLNGKTPKKISDLQGDDLDSFVTDLPLASLIEVDTEDSLMMALAYGAESHYLVENGQVSMKQVEYTKNGNKWYDIDGKELNATFDESTNILTIVDGEDTKEAYIVYDSESGKYYEFKQEDHTKPVLYAKTTVGTLQTDSSSLLDTLEIASLMDITPDSNSILLAIAYGVEDEDYEIVETTENGVTTKKIQMLDGKKPKTLADLTGEEMDSTITNLPLDAIMDVDLNDGMMTSLAYGASNRYTVVGDKVQMKQVEYTKNANKWYDIDGKELNATFDESTNILTIVDGENTKEAYIVYDTESGKYLEIDENGEAVRYKKTTVGQLQNDPASLLDNIELGEVLNVHPEDENPDKLMLALAYGNEGTHYIIGEDGKMQFINGHKARTIADLRGETNLFESIYIGDALDVNAGSHSVLIALAYGEEGVDFIWVDKKDNNGNVIMENGVAVQEVKMLGNSKPRTISEMQGSNSEGLINSITLESALGINGNSDAMMRALAYGQENVHYTLVEDGNGGFAVQMSQAVYTPVYAGANSTNIVAFTNRLDKQVNVGTPVLNGNYYEITLEDESKQYVHKDTFVAYTFNGETYQAVLVQKTTLGQLSSDSSALMDSITLADAMGIAPDETDGLKRSLAYDKNGNAYTIGQLSENPSMIIDAMTLADAIGVDGNSDAMMRALAFGRQGVHYELVSDGNGGYSVDMLQAFYNLESNKMVDRFGVAYDYNEISHEEYFATVSVDNETQYLKEINGKYYAFDEDGNAIDFDYISISQMSEHSSTIMDDMTLADAMGISPDETDGLKRSLAYDKDGNPYTIKQLSENPSMIIDAMTLADAIGVDGNSDAMMRALAFGRQGVHYELVSDGNGGYSVDMLQAFYNLESNKMVDRFGVAYDYNEISHEEYFATVSVDNETQYLKEINGKYYAFDEDDNAIDFDYISISQMSEHSSTIMDDMTLADAMGIAPDETDGLKRSLAYDKNGNPYTIGQLSENPSMIIDSMTLADALNVTPDSERLIIALSYGQQDVHYEIVERTTASGTVKEIEALPAFYALEQKKDDDTAKMYDRFGASHAYEEVNNGSIYEATLVVDGETQYLDLADDGKYFVYDSEGNTVYFEPTTIGQLSSSTGNGSIMNSLTLADALGVNQNDTSAESSLKYALAFAPDGHAYTIGEFAEDPNAIVNNIHIDSIMQPDAENPMTMYLLYGKEGVHYEISELTSVANIPQGATILPNSYTADRSQAKYVVMLYKRMTVHQKRAHTETGEQGELQYDEHGNPILCVHNEYGEAISDHSQGEPINHSQVTILAPEDQMEVEINGNLCNVVYTYTFPDDSNVIHRLLKPQDPTVLDPIRVKGYFTYDHYEPAYFVQMATLDENGNVVKDEFGNEIWTIEKYQPNTIESLTESDLISHLTERLTLEEVLDVNLDENPILKPIAHTTIEELPGAIDSLTITQVFEKDVYKMNLSKTYFLDANDNRLYYNELDKAWYTTETFETGTKSERVLVSTWKYLLKDATPEYVAAQDGAYVYNEESETYVLADESTPASAQRYQQKFTAPEAFKVNDIGALVENMTVNIQNASMQSLVDDKIITLSNDAILTQTIKYQFGIAPFIKNLDPIYREDGTVKETFGELTITEMLDYVAGILALGL